MQNDLRHVLLDLVNTNVSSVGMVQKYRHSTHKVGQIGEALREILLPMRVISFPSVRGFESQKNKSHMTEDVPTVPSFLPFVHRAIRPLIL
jgi:hypothetical protein